MGIDVQEIQGKFDLDAQDGELDQSLFLPRNKKLDGQNYDWREKVRVESWRIAESKDLSDVQKKATISELIKNCREAHKDDTSAAIVLAIYPKLSARREVFPIGEPIGKTGREDEEKIKAREADIRKELIKAFNLPSNFLAPFLVNG